MSEINDGWSGAGGGERSPKPTYWERTHYSAIDRRDAEITRLQSRIRELESAGGKVSRVVALVEQWERGLGDPACPLETSKVVEALIDDLRTALETDHD